MFWLLLGNVDEDKIAVDDPAFALTSTFGLFFIIAHVICTVIVALNMLIAMMNNSFNRIMVSKFSSMVRNISIFARRIIQITFI